MYLFDNFCRFFRISAVVKNYVTCPEEPIKERTAMTINAERKSKKSICSAGPAFTRRLRWAL